MRVNFNYFLSDAVVDYVIDAVTFVARHGHQLLSDYHFDVASGLWRHRDGLVEPPLRLSQLSYDADGKMTYPRRAERAAEAELQRYLAEAAALVATSEAAASDAEAAVSAEFDALRWFDLPARCLT